MKLTFLHNRVTKAIRTLEMNVMKIIQRVLWYFSPCRKCKEKDLEGLVACSCEKGIFKKKWRKRNKQK